MDPNPTRLVQRITVSACIGVIALALADGQRSLRAQLLLGFKPAPSDTGQASGISYSGQATVINITDIHNNPSPIVICDSGPLPSAGGFLEASATETSVADGALTFDMANAETSGDGPEARSETCLNNLFLEIMASDRVTSTL